jgi:uncharacterized phiE125 gp8 family phage protein
MALKLITAAGTEPLTLAQAKLHLRVTASDEDTLVTALITAAREQAEAYTRRRFITQTWDYFRDAFPLGYKYPCDEEKIFVPQPPLQSVTSLKYFDTTGVEQTLATSKYLVDASSEPGRIAPAYGETWPCTREQMNAVTVRFVCGYGAAVAVPSSIAAAMLLIIGHLYENRESTTPDQQMELPLGAESLLAPYRVFRF